MDNTKKRNNAPKNKQKDKKIEDMNAVKPEPILKENTDAEVKSSEITNASVSNTPETQVLGSVASNADTNEKKEQAPIQAKVDARPDFDARLEAVRKKRRKRELDKVAVVGNKVTSTTSRDIKVIAVTALKILLPVAACILVIVTVVSVVNEKNAKDSSAANLPIEEETEDSTAVALQEDALEVNAHEDVNTLMTTFYQALADGDMDTVKALKDYNTDTELITYEKKSEFIESYDNITCYTKKGLEENSYFVYVSYEVKIQGIDTKGPGLIAFYVYTNEDGKLMIDGDMEENIDAALKLVTVQDDVKDLFQRVDVSYQQAVASDEKLDEFLTALPEQMTLALGQELANLESQTQEGADNAETASNTETENNAAPDETQVSEGDAQPNEVPQNQTVNQIVRATSTVNVRSSDSEMADKIGRVETGTEITRTEERINGWSKVIYEGREAYIKSDYLEVVSTQPVADELAQTQGEGDTAVKKAKATTNVNVRNAPNQEANKIGTAQAENTYDVLEDMGEWYKIDYNGQTGYVKAEFFD